jgi:hypothetical protein
MALSCFVDPTSSQAATAGATPRQYSGGASSKQQEEKIPGNACSP